MNPKVAFFPAGLDACALLRMFLTHLNMPDSKFMFSYRNMDVQKFRGSQIAVVQRLCSTENYKALALFKRLGMKIVYDLDDDMWSVPPYNPAHKWMKQLLPGFRICAAQADMITVSTAHLRIVVKSELGKRCPPVEVVENALDFDWFAPIPAEMRKDRGDKVVVGWAGTNTHSEDVRDVFALIPQLLRELPQMEFEIAGVELPSELAEFGDRCRQRDFVPVSEYAQAWRSWQWDMSVAPIKKNKFNLSKSNLKLIEAATQAIPCVASDVGEYTKFCDGNPLLKKHLLAESKSDWVNKIRTLVVDNELRKQVGNEMYRVGKERFDMKQRMVKWNNVFEGVLS